MRRMLTATWSLALVLALIGPVTAPAGAQATREVPLQRLSGGDRVGTAVAVSRAAYPSAEVAVLARADDFADALVAAPLAAQRRAPILLTPRDRLASATAAELDRLGVTEVLIMGGDAAVGAAVERALTAGGRTVTRVAGPTRYATARAAAEALVGPDETAEPVDGEGDDEAEPAAERDPIPLAYVATGRAFPDALSAGPLAAAAGAPILLVTRDEVPEATAAALADLRPQRLVLLGGTGAISEAVARRLGTTAPVSRLAGPNRFATSAAAYDAAVRAGHDRGDLWLADGRSFADALVAGPVVARRGGVLLLVDGSQLERPGPAYDRIRASAGQLRLVTLVGGTSAINGRASQQVNGVAFGAELPRGGRLLFPEHRMVALYGNARSSAMGALGEQPPEQAAERTKRVAAAYAPGGRTILPTFELIITVATRSPGADGMYRSVGSPEEVQRYLDVARRHGIYLLLDIQPGRSDFLTEVRRFERFLREPDVGIALDPEWRMGPGGIPGQGVGSVDAAEVNQVVDYLAGIVRTHRLPQKLLVVHQFQDRMIRNRDQIRTPPELSVNFHADGFGTRSAKLSKYESFLAPRPYSMGFKIFYDEDTNPFQPLDVLAFRVPPDLITYQ
jgi:putative cell wall-binding protein